jgi:hypothetical protein
MNSDTQITIDEILTTVGVVVPCSICRLNPVYAGDEDAERMAYGMAENMRKSGERGLRGMDRAEVAALVKGAIVSTNNHCPSCR